ncbi:Protein-glutamate methylesterase [Candidatus Methylobacter favarea]|uniref:Protein-glutamate methylesterase n=1 Tax=Candidatus Methylobacter favarea TaxID=2707345 RepID=A0A8S0XUV8_9GAMM|nr:chemotaxis protein CheB [Candidatus Methylobacter favarea]CAA9892478.1 Protein-glutamate methylesterase [Candidatus Methylobacter favarea]
MTIDNDKTDSQAQEAAPFRLEDAAETALPVVGIGASAGGLEALQLFLSHLSPETGFAFIVVTHQLPEHVSLLPELLVKFTDMPVVTAEDGMLLEKNQVFVGPPGKNLSVFKRRLHLMASPKHNPVNLPIDYFLRSLADDVQEKSVGIVLSGTGTDGTLGLKAIKGAAGMTMAQEPPTAKFDGMPLSAIAMGEVDFVLPPEKMGQQLIEYSESSNFKDREIDKEEAADLVNSEILHKAFILLRNRTAHDFSGYKSTTLKRRIMRRMNIHQIKNPDIYIEFLQENPVEIDKLFKELLINVTNFFRDPEAFEALSAKALPKLFQDKPDNYEVRVWIPGCSTGEEAYSIAILLREYNEKFGKNYHFQIFATDLDESCIIWARDGSYPIGIAADVSPERLARFFYLKDNHYCIIKEIRDTIIFAVQNLIQQPPFTRLDLISCRNVLIYLNADLQKELLPRFHYALNLGAILFLGSSESIGNFDDLFFVVDGKWKIYQRNTYPSRLPLSKINLYVRPNDALQPPPLKSLNLQSQSGLLGRQIERILMELHVPVSLIINEHGKIFYIHGRTGNYLEPTPGQPSWNIIEMAREGLRMPLMNALNQAVKKGENEIICSGLRVKTNGDFETVDFSLVRIMHPETLKDLFLVSFHPHKKDTRIYYYSKQKKQPIIANNKEKEQLEQELDFIKESLRATVEELQAANEKLKSANEELQSTNEELQSSNEELETSKEEMQSLNEELNTVNSELQNKVEMLSHANNDLQNLLNSTDIATIFLDTDLKIRRYTQPARNLVKLIDSDIGRPLGDLTSNLKYKHLIDDAKKVLMTLESKSIEVQTRRGQWYLLRILPYRTVENMIDGLVITFVDIGRLKKAEKTAELAELTTSIVNTITQPLLVLDGSLQIISANPAFIQAFNAANENLTGQSLSAVHKQAWDSVELRRHLSEILTGHTAFDKLVHDAEFPGLGKKQLIINGRILKQSKDTPPLILLAIDESHEKTR